MIEIDEGYTIIEEGKENEEGVKVDTKVTVRIAPINRISLDIEERIRPLLEEVEAIILRQK